ncbi:hypothetical protein DITRI_Ditri17bG0052600 [Diplodiscus trichospermus]
MKVVIGSNALYLWRSLLEGRKVIIEGSIWRIGSGSKVSILEDKWVKDLPGGLIPRLKDNSLDVQYVSDLMIPSEGRWDIEVMEKCFDEDIIEAVQKTPLSRFNLHDKLIWQESTTGEFFVKSAYYIARRVIGEEIPNRGSRRTIWGILWKAKIVHAKFVIAQEESWFHILFECEAAVKTWDLVLPHLIQMISNIPKNDNFWDILLKESQKKEELELFMQTCWQLWKNRNNCVFNQICSFPSSLAILAKKFTTEYVEVDADTFSLPSNRKVSWSLPPTGMVKINVDVAYSSLDQIAICASVARDDSGKVLCCALKRERNVGSVLHGELLAMQLGCEMALFQGLPHSMLESDSLMAVVEVRKGENSLCQWGGLVMDIISLTNMLHINKILYVNREANSCAHTLAKSPKENGIYSCWVGALPIFCCNSDSS